jgi:hypothetical protein
MDYAEPEARLKRYESFDALLTLERQTEQAERLEAFRRGKAIQNEMFHQFAMLRQIAVQCDLPIPSGMAWDDAMRPTGKAPGLVLLYGPVLPEKKS